MSISNGLQPDEVLELEEVFSLSDRILVLYEGKIVKEFDPEKTTDKEVGFYMTGGKKE